MLGMNELKEKIEITDTTVECPVKGCSEKVERQREFFKREGRFRCPKHNIYISPSTFEYQSELDNLLWKDKVDLDLFEKIKKVKRESRIVRDNSEDAITWNVFRFLEKNNLICNFLQHEINLKDSNAEVIYWGYSQPQGGVWDYLQKAREEFELVPSKGSEPDIIIAGKTLTIIEAKFGAGNKTTPSKPYVEEKYVAGGGGWWEKVFSSDFNTVAVKCKKYELSRFWLLGTWMASQLNLNFKLISLTLSNQDRDIENTFKKHIKEDNSRTFKRITWEQIFEYISNSGFSGHDKETMIRYFKNKTIGYDSNGNLKRAFSV